MTYKKPVGRPPKVNYKVMNKLEDAIKHGSSVLVACEYAGITRQTYYRHYRNKTIFADKMKIARIKFLLPVQLEAVMPNLNLVTDL